MGNIAVRKRLIKWIDESIYNGQRRVGGGGGRREGEYRAAGVRIYVDINRRKFRGDA